MDDWTETKSIQGRMEILVMMQKACFWLGDVKQNVMNEVKSKKDLFLLYQKPEVSNTEYL